MSFISPQPDLESKLQQTMLTTVKAEKPRNQNTMFAVLFLVLASTIAGATYLIFPRQNLFLLKNFTTATVERATIAENVSGTGTVISDLSVDIKSPLSGQVLALLVKENDTVRPNQRLAKLESPALTSELEQATLALELAQNDLSAKGISAATNARIATNEITQAKQQLETTQRSYQNLRTLYDIGAESRQNLENALQNLRRDQRLLQAAQAKKLETAAQDALQQKNSQMQIRAAQKRLQKAKLEQGKLEVRSSIGGKVVRLAVNDGDALTVGGRLLTVVSLERLRIDGRIDQNNASRLQLGQRVQIQLSEQNQIGGQVISVGTEASAGQNGNVVAVQVRPDSLPKNFRPGMTLSLEYQVGLRQNVLSLPRGAFLSSGSGNFVFVLEGERAKRRLVQLGSASPERIEVQSGLREFERVITSSYEMYKDQKEILVSLEGELK